MGDKVNNDREELIDAIVDAYVEDRLDAAHILDRLASDPVRVLRWLEGLPCQTCGGTGCADPCVCEHMDDPCHCSACGGSGILGRDGVDKLRGFKQVGRAHLDAPFPYFATDPSSLATPVFARLPVPEPSRGELTPELRARFEAAVKRGLEGRRVDVLLDGARNAFAGGLSVRDGLARFEAWRAVTVPVPEPSEGETP